MVECQPSKLDAWVRFPSPAPKTQCRLSFFIVFFVDIELLKELIKKLCNQEPLDDKYRDHNLSGDMKKFRECHILPNWLLIYQIGSGIIVFDRTGTHSDLFE